MITLTGVLYNEGVRFDNSLKVTVTVRELYEVINRKYVPATAVENLEEAFSERPIKAIARDTNCNINGVNDCRHSQLVIRGWVQHLPPASLRWSFP